MFMKKIIALSVFSALLLGLASSASASWFSSDSNECYGPYGKIPNCNEYDEWDPRYWMEEMEDMFDDDDDYYGGGYGGGRGYGQPYYGGGYSQPQPQPQPYYGGGYPQQYAPAPYYGGGYAQPYGGGYAPAPAPMQAAPMQAAPQQ